MVTPRTFNISVRLRPAIVGVDRTFAFLRLSVQNSSTDLARLSLRLFNLAQVSVLLSSLVLLSIVDALHCLHYCLLIFDLVLCLMIKHIVNDFFNFYRHHFYQLHFVLLFMFHLISYQFVFRFFYLMLNWVRLLACLLTTAHDNTEHLRIGWLKMTPELQ